MRRILGVSTPQSLVRQTMGMGNWGAVQWWSFVLSLSGAVVTAGAVVWVWLDARSRRDKLRRRHDEWQEFQRRKSAESKQVRLE